MKYIYILISTIIFSGCVQNSPGLSTNTNQLFDQKDWKPVNNNSIQREIGNGK